MTHSSQFRLIRLANGTYSLHSVVHGETFHPVIGPVAEAEILYVDQLRLSERLAQEDELVIWDVGLGGAANAITVLRAGRCIPSRLRLISFDQTLEPLRFALSCAPSLSYFGDYIGSASALANEGRRELQFQNGEQQVSWELELGDFPSLISGPRGLCLPSPHAILFDAYSPATNPAMWTLPLFTTIRTLLYASRPCVLPTYSRSTLLRVTLLLAGFFVGRGAATGKKEETTIAANCAQLIQDPLDQKWLARARASSSAEPLYGCEYRQSPLMPESWEKLRLHPQFTAHSRSSA